MEHTWNFASVFAYWNVLAVGLVGTLKLFVICSVLGFTITDNPGAILMATRPAEDTSFRISPKEIRCVNLGTGIEQRVGIDSLVTKLVPKREVIFVREGDEDEEI